MTRAAIEVVGLREFSRELRAALGRTPKELQQTNKSVAELIAEEAERRAPKRSGRLAASIRPRATQRSAEVRGGSRRVEYFGVQEFGGSVPVHKGRAFPRRHIKPYNGPRNERGDWWDRDDGYFLYPAGRAKRQEILESYGDMLEELTRRAFPV